MRAKAIAGFAVASPALLFLFVNWFGYELFGRWPGHESSNVGLFASMAMVVLTGIAGLITSLVAARNVTSWWRLLFWLMALINALCLISWSCSFVPRVLGSILGVW